MGLIGVYIDGLGLIGVVHIDGVGLIQHTYLRLPRTCLVIRM
jgi:hypothetical protein